MGAWNKTPIPDGLLLPVIGAALRRVEEKHVIIYQIRVNVGLAPRRHGIACPWSGKIKLWVGADDAELPLDMAFGFFGLAVHEIFHVFDPGDRAPSHNGRRPAWADRPEEKRAVAAEQEAIRNVTERERAMISRLAMWLADNPLVYRRGAPARDIYLGLPSDDAAQDGVIFWWRTSRGE